MSGRRRYRNDDEMPTLYVRQVHYSARSEDLRALFERMGPVRDVYIPLDYYTRESRGFAYVKYEFTRDAEDALKLLNGASILGRKIEVDWAEGQRKTKTEMRAKDPYSNYLSRGRSGRDRSPRRRRSRSRHHSRSRSYSRLHSCSHSHSRSRSHSHSRLRERSRSNKRSHGSWRHRSSSAHHHQSGKWTNSSRSSSPASHSARKSYENGRKEEKSKSSSGPKCSPASSGKNMRRNTGEQDIVPDQSNVPNPTIAKERGEAVVDALQMRSEERASDKRKKDDEKKIRKSSKKSGENGNVKEGARMATERNGAAVGDEKERDKVAKDIEVIDEVTEPNSIVLKDIVAEYGSPPDESANAQELVVMDSI